MENPDFCTPTHDCIAVIPPGLFWEVSVDLDELVQIAMAVWNEPPQVEIGRLIDSVKLGSRQ
jgi:hypothetical protein